MTIHPSRHKGGNAPPGKREKPNADLMVAVKGGGILFIGQIYEQVSGFVFAIFMGRYLGAADYGTYKLALTIVFAVAVIATLGLGGGMNRFIPLARAMRSDARVWGIIQLGTGIPLAIGLFLAAIIFALARPIALGIFEEPALVPILATVAFAIPLHVTNLSLAAVVQGFKQVKLEFFAQDLGFNTIKLVLSVGAILAGLGVIGVTYAYVISEFAAFLLLFFLVNRMFSFLRPIRSAERPTKEVLAFSLPLFVSQFLNQFGRRFETLVLGAFGVMMDVGIYSAILVISDIGNRAYLALRKISAPIFAELHHAGKMDELRAVYQSTSKWALIVNLPFFATIVLFADNLLRIFGNDFVLGAQGLVILACGTLVNAATGACGTLISMIGRSRVTLMNSAIYLTATIVIDLLLIPPYGLIGAAWAGSLTIMLVNIIRLLQVRHLLNGLLPFNWSFIKPIIAICATSAIIYGLRSVVLLDHPIVQFVVLGALTMIVYFGILLALGFSSEDKAIANRLLRKMRKRKPAAQRVKGSNDS